MLSTFLDHCEEEIEEEILELEGGFKGWFLRHPVTKKWHIDAYGHRQSNFNVGGIFHAEYIYFAESLGWEYLEFDSPAEAMAYIEAQMR